MCLSYFCNMYYFTHIHFFLTQLIMTVLMTCVVIYLYTVIAFNYFRKFYIQQSSEDGEHVYTCDSMSKVSHSHKPPYSSSVTVLSTLPFQCFVYHIDKGLRAGGGIGDVLQSASGHPDEFFRLLFDVTFFFFVIVMLLAIIQGMCTSYRITMWLAI